MENLKDHLVVQGYEPQKALDFDEMFVLVVKWGTIQTMVAIVEQQHWEVKHLNVKTSKCQDHILKWRHIRTSLIDPTSRICGIWP
jgi:hypothetical protein